MKAWIKKLSGILLASLLAAQLSGKAFADLEPQPEEPKTEISEPAAAAEAPDATSATADEAPVSANEVPAATNEAPAPVNEAPAAVSETQAEADTPKETPAQAADAPADNASEQTEEIPAKVEAAQNTDALVSLNQAQFTASEADLEENIPAAPAADPDEPAPAADELPAVDTEKPAKVMTAADDTAVLLQEESADDANILAGDEPSEVDMTDISMSAAPRKLSSSSMLLTSSGDTAGTEETVTLRSAPAGDEGEEDGGKDPAGDPAEDKSGGESEAKGSSSAQNNPIRVTDNGTFVLVNHSGTEHLSAEEGDLNVLAAGFNKITSLSASGSVNITGTGIMLIDSLTGSLALNTFNDIYPTGGSVALFVKQDNDDSYVLRNGSVPGILDEEYKVEGYKLVIPNGSSLNLIGTGVMMLVDKDDYVLPAPDAGPDDLKYDEVVYYHGSDHSYVCYDFTPPEGKVVVGGTETAGKLTIGAGAELVIEQGGSVVMQDLKSYNGYGSKKMPELIFTGGGKLTVNGSLGSGGVVKFDGTGVLSGSSTITASRIIIDAPAAVSGTDVSFSSREILINGSGELNGLKIKDSKVYPHDNSITLTGLVSSGTSSVILPDAFTLNISSVEGALHLMQRRYLQNTDISEIPAGNMVDSGSGEQTNKRDNFYGVAGYSDEYANIISGSISGSGTISFDSGIFKLINLTKGSGISFSNAFGGLVYDYSDVMPSASSPIHLKPSDVERADDNNGVIRVVAVTCDESRDPYSAYTLGGYGLGSGIGIRWGTKELTLLNTAELGEIHAEQIEGITGGLCIKEKQLIDLAKNNIPEMDNHPFWGILVELVHKTDSGSGSETFSSQFIPPQTLTGDGEGYIFADGVCLVRIYYVYDFDEVAGGGEALQTSTSHTGTGILGGLGGNLSVYTEPDPVVPDPVDPDPVVPDPVVPDPVVPDPVVPDPVVPDPAVTETVADEPVTVQAPVVAQGEKAPEEVLFWVEEQPADTAAASSPQAEASPAAETYVLNAAEGEKTLEELGGTVTVTMKYTPPSVAANKPLYVVFIGEDGSLTAMKASYSVLTKQLKFTTDRLGTFTVIGFDFSGEEFSDEFYEALAKIPELRKIIESLKN